MNENNNNSFFEKLATQNPATSTQPVIPPITNKSRSNRNILFGIIAVVVLLFAVGSGVFLVQQNQNLRSNAAVPAGCNVSYSGNSFTLSGDCPGSILTFTGDKCPTTQNLVGSSGAGPGTYTANPGSAGCQQVDYDPSSDPGQGIGVCACAGGGNGSSGTPPPDDEPTRTCGESCNNDDMCKRGNPNSVCRNNICVNPQCPGKTRPGANCECDAKNACGQPCGILVGLCQAGSTCGFINIDNPNKCTSYETQSGGKQSPRQFCIPKPAFNGYTTIKSCTDMAVNNLAKPDGSITGLTQQDILTACTQQASPSPSPTGQLTAQCGNVVVYDSDWTVIPTADLKKLKAGDVVRLAVSGTTTGGQIDKAKFTVNGNNLNETSTKKPGSEEYYVEYTIPTGQKNFSVSAQVHHSTLGWF